MGELHHVTNHFTIALLNLGILFELLGYRSKSENMRSFGWISLRLSLGFAVLSVLTGFVSEGAVQAMVDAAKPVNAYHKSAAFGTLVLLAASVITRLSAKEKFTDAVRGATVRAVYFTLLVITFALGTAAAILGMELTYGYGVNVEPYERILQALPPKVQQPIDTFSQLPTSPIPPPPSNH